jgi:hypothetical protein
VANTDRQRSPGLNPTGRSEFGRNDFVLLEGVEVFTTCHYIYEMKEPSTFQALLLLRCSKQ